MIRTWALGILSVLVTASFVIYTINVQKQDTLRSARTQMINSVHFLNMDIERTFYGLDQTFKGLQNYLSAINSESSTEEINGIQTTLTSLAKENPFVTTLLILDANGIIRYGSGPGVKPDLRYTDFFSVHKKQNLEQLYIGRPAVSKLNKKRWTFSVSKGLRSDAGRLESVMVAMINLDYMRYRYQIERLPAGMTLTISSSEDYVYLQIPEQNNSVGRYIHGITRKPDVPNKTLLVRYQKPGSSQARFLASRKIGTYPLYVSINQLESTILANWWKSARNFLFVGGLISIVLLFLTQRVASYQKKQLMIKEELRNLASTDSLTGLANRRFVLEQAAREISKAKRSNLPLAFILIDLDHFKEVNDKYGHEVGDRVLKETAIIFQKLCRESDVVSRYGGEEFLLVLPNTSLNGALADAERIRCALERTSHWCERRQFVITASFGVSEWLASEENCDPVLRRADDALYKVKKAGRNSIMSLPMANVRPLRKNYKQQRVEA